MKRDDSLHERGEREKGEAEKEEVEAVGSAG